MSLDKKDRLILANQYRILAKVDKGHAKEYDKWREALEEGYELAYNQIFNSIYDNMSEQECGEVIQTLAMYDALQRSYAALPDESGIDEEKVIFPGFDGNNETSQMTYARYVREREGRFTYLKVASEDLNGHFPSLDIYERMRAAWEQTHKSYGLSREQMLTILEARRYRRD